MIYISKGILKCSFSFSYIQVAHNAQVQRLRGIEAELWKKGRFGFAKSKSYMEDRVLKYLEHLGLVELEEEHQGVSKYRILTRCICCTTIKKWIPLCLRKKERTLYKWIRDAGLRLSTAELVYLTENQIVPSGNLLGAANRQSLVDRMYTKSSIFDNLLENQMEHAKKRDDTVVLIERLLKKRIIMMM